MNTVTVSLPGSHTLPAFSTRPGIESAQALLIHGWSCRRADWQGTLRALGDQYGMLAPDLPGHGDARDVPMANWTVDALAAVVALLATEAARPVLVGHSMGGAVALEAARRAPAQVAGVVLVDTFVIPYGDLTEQQAAVIEAPFVEDFPAAMQRLVDNSTAPVLPAREKARLARTMAQAPTDKMLPLWADLLRWSPDTAFAALAAEGVPIHAINGEGVGDLAQARCEAFVQARTLPGAAHFPQLEMPEIFHQALDEVLASLV